MKVRHLVAPVGILAGLPALGVMTAENQESTKTTSKIPPLHLGTARMICSLDSSGTSLTVVDDLDYPMLVQSGVLAGNQKDPAPFVVTPLLFRLDTLQLSRLRIVRTGGGFSGDREGLQWLCAKDIPPEHDGRWAEERGADKKKADKAILQVNLSANSRAKLLVRPSAVKGCPEDAGGKVEWTKSDSRLKGNNPTSFYINISELSVDGKEAKGHRHISPCSSYECEIPFGVSGKVSWTVITNCGGKSGPFKSELKS